MSEANYSEIVDALMLSVEESIDDSGADLDYENSGGMLTITCENNGSQVILSRQPAVQEVWLAAKSGGFHFRLEGNTWVNTQTGEPLAAMLGAALTEQCGESVTFNF